MNEFYTVLTQMGINEIYNSMLENRAFNACYMGFGDSNGSYYEPEDDQEQLKNQKFKVELYKQGKNESGNYIYFRAQIPPSVGDFIVREVGLFDSKDNLLAIAKYPETKKVKADSLSDKSLNIELQIMLSSNAFNNIIIDDSGVLTTKTELQNSLETKADVDLSNITLDAKNLMANASMPSCEVVDLSVGATNTKYIAPDDGYFYFQGVTSEETNISTNTGAVLEICYSDNTLASRSITWFQGYGLKAFLPVCKGREVYINYGHIRNNHELKLKFLKAQGVVQETGGV